MNNLGMKARDKVTGFEGIITGKINYLYGCSQYGIVPPVTPDNKIGDCQWFDEGRIEILGKGITAASVQVEKPGGVNRDAPR